MSDPLSPYFLGAWAENNDLLEKVLLELVRDHVYWRRNFHPDDTPPIATTAQLDDDYRARVAGMTRELHRLTSQLKRSVPTFHPRYIGHMTSELLLPGLLAQLVTTIYNPNNIVEEVAPVTLALEYEAGQGLCRMVGFGTDSARVPCATGHLTSGGTLANDEALWLARAVKLFPLAVKDACEATKVWPDESLRGADDWALLGWPVSRCLDLARRLQRHPELQPALDDARVEALGLARFCQRHPLVADLAVLAPASAHYSWVKAMKLLGLGAAQLHLVPTLDGRVDVAAMAEALARCERARVPVLAVVGVYGSTELGAFDELDALAALRRPERSFWFHVDAAWGGYLPTVFRKPDGGLRPRAEITREFRYFPSERVYRSTAALAEADSVTVDPHKLGFTPYGAGAFLVKDRRAFDLVMQRAAYVFLDTAADDSVYRNAGRFSLEGSRPGAAAAAVALNHRVLPLDHQHFGLIIARSVRACESLYGQLPRVREALAGVARVVAPFEPDCNVVGLSFNPAGNRSLRAANAFTRALYESVAVKPKGPAQQPSAFFGTCTTLSLAQLGDAERRRLADELDLDLAQPDADGLFLLRHALMNPWLLASPEPGEGTYIDAYLAHLIALARAEARAAPRPA
ncbi:MAG: pyridoxal-dependent decarboxylase [Myxococcus sp.]|nr:pyridoxal-dependent decarboxylase [Myxococcus sp.]